MLELFRTHVEQMQLRKGKNGVIEKKLKKQRGEELHKKEQVLHKKNERKKICEKKIKLCSAVILKLCKCQKGKS